MKKYSLLKILLLVFVGVCLLSWILPATSYNGGLIEDVRKPLGLFDLFSYPLTSLYYFGQIAVLLLVIGGFYGVLSKIVGYRVLLNKIVNWFKGKETVFLISTIVLLSVFVSICGMNAVILFFLPFIAALILLMGYKRIVVAITFIGSYSVGLIGSILSKNLSYYTELMSVDYKTEIITKVMLLLVGIVVLVFNLLIYNKVNPRKNSISDDDAKLIPEDTKEKKAVWPIVVLFDCFVILLILGCVNWSGAFGVSLFTDIHTSITKFTIGEFAIFGNLLGGINPFGSWSEIEVICLLFIFTILFAIVYKMKFNEVIDAFKSGAKKFIGPTILALLSFAVLVSITIHPVLLTILSPMLKLVDGLNIVFAAIASLVTSLFNCELYYQVNSIVPYMVELAGDSTVNPLITVVNQSMYGFSQLFAPTGIVLLATLSYLGISYKNWMKDIWKILVQLFVILFVIYIIMWLI